MNIAFNMDCMEGMRQYPDGYFDLAVVDPPYGIERFKRGGSHINRYGGHEGQWNNVKPDEEYFFELFRVSKNAIIWGANNFSLPPSEGFLIWDKVNPENFSFAMCEMAWTNIKTPAKIFRYNSQHQGVRIHPTQKPIQLYNWIFSKWTSPGFKILDTYLGSGTSRRAAYDMGLDFVGFEIDKTYFDLQEQAFAEHTAQLRIDDL